MPSLQAAGYSLVPDHICKDLPGECSQLKADMLAGLVHWFLGEVKASEVSKPLSPEEQEQVSASPSLVKHWSEA